MSNDNPHPETPTARCPYCDGTGDVHNLAGEWLGECKLCQPHNHPAETPPAGQDGDSVWMRTCIHHTDAQRDTANQCPVCILRERDTLASQLAQAQQERDELIRQGNQQEYVMGQLTEILDAPSRGELVEAAQLTMDKLTAARAECERLREERATLKAALTAISRNQSEKAGEEGLCPHGCDAPWIAMSTLGLWTNEAITPWQPGATVERLSEKPSSI